MARKGKLKNTEMYSQLFTLDTNTMHNGKGRHIKNRSHYIVLSSPLGSFGRERIGNYTAEGASDE
jgi:hypothetical protein